MQIYLRCCTLYGFDQQRAFEAKYIAGNFISSLEHQKYDKKNVKYRNNVQVKS